jgi:hypothetical protein
MTMTMNDDEVLGTLVQVALMTLARTEAATTVLAREMSCCKIE